MRSLCSSARSRHPFARVGSLATALALGLALAGCGTSLSATTTGVGTPGAPVVIRIGTLQTDDILPLWAAVADGSALAAGLDLQIQTFISAQEQTTAVTAGELDAIMTDMVVPVQLTASGTHMRAVTRLQGAPAGIVVAPGSGISTVAGLAGVPVGSSSPTVMEFILDKAMTQAGVPHDQIVTEEIKNLGVRLQMLSSGQIKAAVLPWTLHALAVSQGNVSLLGVEEAGPYSQTVLAFRDAWLTATPHATDVMNRLFGVWDGAVAKINANPANFRTLLAQQAKLPAPLDQTYEVRQYPTHATPDQALFEAVVTWMVGKGYLAKAIPYAELVWVP